MRSIFFIFFISVHLYAITSIADKSAQLQLTQEQKQWLLEHPRIIVGMDPDYAPYEWVDKDGNHIGVVVDYMRELEKILGVHFEIVKNKSWEELLGLAKKGELDMLTSIVKTPERSKYLTFSEPYHDAPTIIVDNGKGTFIGNLKQLSNKRVVVEKDYFMAEFINNKYPNILLISAPNTKEALKMVLDGKADAYVGDANLVDYIIKKNHFNSLRFSGQTEYVSHQAFALTKGNEPLALILTQAMATIPKEEFDAMFNHWLNIDYGISRETLAKYSLFIALIFSIIGYWVYLLRREISHRKLAEQKLKTSETLYRELTEDVTDVIWKADSHHILTYISPSVEEQLGFRPDELVGHHVFEMFTDEGIAIIMERIKQRKENKEEAINDVYSIFEVQHKRKDGSFIWGEVVSKAVYDKNKTVIGYHGISRDTTARKEMEKEKELLYQELDHRVKNNLQVISSIVSLHSLQEDTSRSLEDIHNTISAISLAHDKLHQNATHKTLEIKHYITALLDNLLASSVLDIQKEVNSPEIYLNAPYSITLGIIINEFVSNAIKYAFKGISSPKITVNISKKQDFIAILVSDNGIGFKEEEAQNSGIGMDIITTLVKSKFKTDVRFFHSNGTSMSLKIPYM
ncbi:MAG: transporter substrate-binding domain-containing protein [Sulfurospirillaceae bacterium]|nr:transporter substrate-binding domain-containing protein [Sulfurospirillaceae bacterium]